MSGRGWGSSSFGNDRFDYYDSRGRGSGRRAGPLLDPPSMSGSGSYQDWNQGGYGRSMPTSSAPGSYQDWDQGSYGRSSSNTNVSGSYQDWDQGSYARSSASSANNDNSYYSRNPSYTSFDKPSGLLPTPAASKGTSQNFTGTFPSRGHQVMSPSAYQMPYRKPQAAETAHSRKRVFDPGYTGIPNKKHAGSRNSANGGKEQFQDKSKDQSGAEEEDDNAAENDPHTEKSAEGDVDDDPYAGIPKHMIYCHVCIIHFDDVPSLLNHVRTNGHQRMMDSMLTEYRLKTEVLRHQSLAAEQRLEPQGEQSQRKPPFRNPQYCPMCDVHFFGSGVHHRKSNHHQRLKAYVHPTCDLCNKSFHNRMDRDHHRLSEDHLKNLAALGASGKLPITDEYDEVQDLVSLDVEEKSATAAEKTENEAEKGSYNPEELTGMEFVKKVSVYFCRACRKYYSSELDAMDVHCRTKEHHERCNRKDMRLLQTGDDEPNNPDDQEQKEENDVKTENEKKGMKEADIMALVDTIDAEVVEMDKEAKN